MEIEPVIELHTFRLGDTGYVESGIFTAGDTVAAPGLVWATVDVSALED
ncbi:hypothetical protein [Phytohabitans rumicis]|nr:hypothetical protein [Phytohabitans rumicis]